MQEQYMIETEALYRYPPETYNYVPRDYHWQQLKQRLLHQQKFIIIGFYMITPQQKKKNPIIITKCLDQLFKTIGIFGQLRIQQIQPSILPIISSYTHQSIHLQYIGDQTLTQFQSYQQKFFKSICHINFLNLTELNLASSNINNFQAITFINAPCLQVLDLFGNQLSNINGISKSQFSQLRDLDIRLNRIVQTQRFNRINSVKLKYLSFYSLRSRKYLVQDVKILLKLNYKLQPKKIWEQRYQQKKCLIQGVVKKLNQDFNSITLKFWDGSIQQF